MAYKNDSYIVLANKYGGASAAAKAQLFEVYDQLRDLTVSGPSISGSGFGTAGSFLWNIASLLSPSAFMPVMGGSQSMNIPGTSYWSPISGGNSTLYGGISSFGLSELGNYPGFPSGAAPVQWGFGTYNNSDGYFTGGASSLSSSSEIAGMASAAAYGLGTSTGLGFGNNLVLPLAGIVSGWGGIMQAAAPYLDTFGLPAMVVGNLMQGTSSAALAAYQNVTGRIQTNADTILSNKVRNIETVCKMLDTQGDIVKKMLKEQFEGDKNQLQNL